MSEAPTDENRWQGLSQTHRQPDRNSGSGYRGGHRGGDRDRGGQHRGGRGRGGRGGFNDRHEHYDPANGHDEGAPAAEGSYDQQQSRPYKPPRSENYRRGGREDGGEGFHENRGGNDQHYERRDDRPAYGNQRGGGGRRGGGDDYPRQPRRDDYDGEGEGYQQDRRPPRGRGRGGYDRDREGYNNEGETSYRGGGGYRGRQDRSDGGYDDRPPRRDHYQGNDRGYGDRGPRRDDRRFGGGWSRDNEERDPDYDRRAPPAPVEEEGGQQYEEPQERQAPPPQRQQHQPRGGQRPSRRQPPHDEEEVEALFKSHHKQTGTGIDFNAYDSIEVDIVPKNIEPVNSFDELMVHDALAANLAKCGYQKPTPVQKWGIPVSLSGKDLMACAQTGSGKTAAFLIPMVQYILVNGVSLTNQRVAFPIAVIMAPTRELALQIYQESRKCCFRTDVATVVVYGGTEYSEQIHALETACDIIVATPGRLKDMFDKGKVAFERVKFLVLDEADRMLELGFEEQVEELVCGRYSDMPGVEDRQTMMYSATFPRPIQNLAKRYMKKASYLLTVGRVGSTTKNITQKVMLVEDKDKQQTVLRLLYVQTQTDLVLIFMQTKHEADELVVFLSRNDIPCAAIHGDRKQWEREKALASFKSGETPILVATDVASRGLDIPNVAHVIQYDLPNSLEDYVHRIGRTGRAGNKGSATAFFNRKNESVRYELMRYLKDHEQPVPDWMMAAQQEAANVVSTGAVRDTGRRGRGGRRDDFNGGGGSAPRGPAKEDEAELVDDWEALAGGGGGGGGGRGGRGGNRRGGRGGRGGGAEEKTKAPAKAKPVFNSNDGGF